MAESNDQQEQRELEELKGKNIAHYSVMLGALINAQIESNKAIFTFSSAAIGLLVTQSKTQEACGHTPMLYKLALIAFFVAACSTLFVFVSNANEIESRIRNEGKEKSAAIKLRTWKYINYISFGVGLLLTLAFAIKAFS